MSTKCTGDRYAAMRCMDGLGCACGVQPVNYVTFHKGHMHVDVARFLASPIGKYLLRRIAEVMPPEKPND